MVKLFSLAVHLGRGLFPENSAASTAVTIGGIKLCRGKSQWIEDEAAAVVHRPELGFVIPTGTTGTDSLLCPRAVYQ